MADDDYPGVPLAWWYELSRDVTSLMWGYLGLFALLLLLAWTLVSKGVITWRELFTIRAPVE